MEFQIPDLYPAIAEIFVAAMALLILLVAPLMKRGATTFAYYASQLTILAAAAIAYTTTGKFGFTFSYMYVDDPMGDLLKVIACLCVSMALLYGRSYMADRKLESPEYYLLVLFSLLGIMVLIAAGSLLTVYLGLELLSLSSYALVAINRDSA
ncbi:MAG TPA: NADH:ubiquinone oxidoreductase subunit N, partial [Rhodocyclaceae bacterium]|nr:NADH:ubiquinone oxidoreductase subunit N [Rhodocyclaceae bacterium]